LCDVFVTLHVTSNFDVDARRCISENTGNKQKKHATYAKKIGANHTYLSLKKLPSPAIMRGFIVGDT